MGIIDSFLSACGVGETTRPDAPAVQEDLQDAVELTTEHLDGAVVFRDSETGGTTITGTLSVAGETREQVTGCFASVLETLVRTYREQEGLGPAEVKLEAHPACDRTLRVRAHEVMPDGTGGRVTTDDLADHFEI